MKVKTVSSNEMNQQAQYLWRDNIDNMRELVVLSELLL